MVSRLYGDMSRKIVSCVAEDAILHYMDIPILPRCVQFAIFQAPDFAAALARESFDECPIMYRR